MGFIVNIAFVLTGLVPIVTSSFSGDIHAHDPTFIHAGNCYYIMATGGGIKKLCNDKSTGAGSLFHGPLPNWIKNITGKLPGGLWAPDINFINGEYYVYYAAAIWNQPNCTIGLATAKKPEGPYTDQGEVWYGKTGIYLIICCFSELRSYTM